MRENRGQCPACCLRSYMRQGSTSRRPRKPEWTPSPSISDTILCCVRECLARLFRMRPDRRCVWDCEVESIQLLLRSALRVRFVWYFVTRSIRRTTQKIRSRTAKGGHDRRIGRKGPTGQLEKHPMCNEPIRSLESQSNRCWVARKIRAGSPPSGPAEASIRCHGARCPVASAAANVITPQMSFLR